MDRLSTAARTHLNKRVIALSVAGGFSQRAERREHEARGWREELAGGRFPGTKGLVRAAPGDVERVGVAAGDAGLSLIHIWLPITPTTCEFRSTWLVHQDAVDGVGNAVGVVRPAEQAFAVRGNVQQTGQ